MKVPQRIPIASARRFAREQQCRQVIIFAWDGDRSHVVTCGESEEDCARAAELGNQMKRGLGWPESLQAQPSRVRFAIREAVAPVIEVLLEANRFANPLGVTREKIGDAIKMLRNLGGET
jgi:hypothetical protein